MSEAKHRRLFENHLPEKAVDYCYALWQELGFNFRITKKRQSKYGDYRYDPTSQSHHISVNHDLNCYAFLVTYIHEVAHKVTFEKHKREVLPHGLEWKHEFKKLMLPLLREDIFPMDVLGPLARHMKNPKATSTSDKALFVALRNHDKNKSGLLLKEVETGAKFLFNKKVYRKLEVRRTRSLCELTTNQRKYLISETAPVQVFKN
ncbi:transcription elongation protein SprT [Reichenbachiella carrageenanivorans]|uniref:Transcription elongation protein SprT n=1 Tax=Reichenbachiella carrageenanivorans TaxID=2979869 RepID=A0ABY6CY47_9BACT|nr:transcription elongation protein SprT [Reichenbachiella carrageenanivorans]UXX78839.1 transcription elongation protein SprT [Reichenbachiella carrageenanivorans]